MSAPGPLIHELFLAAVHANPEKPALITADGAVSYGELAEQVGHAASAMDAQHMRRVALNLRNGPGFAEAFFGALAGGAVAMVWDPAWPDAVREQLSAAHPPDLIADQDWATWLQRQEAPRAIQSQANEDMPFLIGFTSGSSGPPKAFIRSHKSWTESLRASAIEFGLKPDDVVALAGPFSHGLSLYAMVEALCCGATVLCQSVFQADGFLDLMDTHGATQMVTPPVLLDLLAAQASRAMPEVRAVITAGDKLQPSVRHVACQTWPQADIIEYYGASELSFVSVAKSSERAPSNSVGRAFQSVDIEIRDPAGRAVPHGVEGEVWVKSQMLSHGYIGETDPAFRLNDGWATVGDLGVLSEAGWLTLTGRANHMIITAGHNVSPSAVEAELAQVVKQPVVVVGLTDVRWGQVVCAVKEGASWSEDERTQASEAVLRQLPRASVPRAWRTLDSFPRLSSGKVNRRAVAEQLAAVPQDR